MVRWLRVERLDAEGHVPGLLDDPAGVLHRHPAALVEFDPVFLPGEQGDLQLGFQPLHGAAERRLGDVQLFCGVGQGPARRHGQQLLQLIEFKHVRPPLCPLYQ